MELRLLPLLLVVALMGCFIGCGQIFGHKFDVGDCYTSKSSPKDPWLPQRSIYKVLEVGEESYRVAYMGNVHPRIKGVETYQHMIFDRYYKEVPCS